VKHLLKSSLENISSTIGPCLPHVSTPVHQTSKQTPKAAETMHFVMEYNRTMLSGFISTWPSKAEGSERPSQKRGVDLPAIQQLMDVFI